MTRYSVAVQEDHIQRLVRRPLAGVAELIWNALDADADRVDVKLIRGDLGGLDAVIVEDDGHGMSHIDATEVFRNLGGSWKRFRDATRIKKRRMHGSAGERVASGPLACRARRSAGRRSRQATAV